MKRQKLEIGHPLRLNVLWYDHVCTEPLKAANHEGEIVGWRDSQIVVRVKDYAVIRFWKKNGLEVGNADHQRRGFRIDLQELEQSLKPAPGVDIAIAVDGEASPSP